MEPGKELSSDDHFQSVMERMQKLRERNMYCDVTLSVSATNFPANRAILAASSEFFDKMFSSNMKEKHAGTVELKDITVHALDAILRFLYTSKIVISEENVADLLQTAHMMQIFDLLELIEDFMETSIELENCLYFGKLSLLYSLERSKETVKQYILNNFEAVSQLSAFDNILREDLETYLTSDDLMIKSENTAYESVMKWTKKDLVNRRDFFPGLFSLVKLQLITPDYLCDVVRRESLVKNFQACSESVEDTLDFHIRPNKHNLQQPRKGHKFDSNYVALCCNDRTYIYNNLKETNKLIEVKKQMMASCAIASRYQTVTCCGGYPCNSQVACETVVSFDGLSWKELPPMKTGRAGASAVYVKDQLHVFGGEANKRTTVKSKEDFVDNIEVFNRSTKTWISSGSLQTQRSFAAAVVVNDLVYLLGGYVVHAKHKYQDIVKILNLRTQTHTNRPMFGAEQVRTSGYEVSSIVEIYNTTSKTWTTSTPMPQQRACFGAAIWNSKIYAVGGYTVDNSTINNSL